jgi:hypothetical protein
MNATSENTDLHAARERWRHVGNEWADLATSVLQSARNIADGISDPASALANMQNCQVHCDQVQSEAQVADGGQTASLDQILLARKAEAQHWKDMFFKGMELIRAVEAGQVEPATAVDKITYELDGCRRASEYAYMLEQNERPTNDEIAAVLTPLGLSTPTQTAAAIAGFRSLLKKFGRNGDSAQCFEAAIEFALTADNGLEFLRLWNQGEFNVCRDRWPQAPNTCYQRAGQQQAEAK